MNKQANKLQRHGGARNTIPRGRNCEVCKRTTTLYFSLVQLNRLKQHPTTSASKSFNFTIEIKHFYSRHCRSFRFQATISPISLIYDVKSPAHLTANCSDADGSLLPSTNGKSTRTKAGNRFLLETSRRGAAHWMEGRKIYQPACKPAINIRLNAVQKYIYL